MFEVSNKALDLSTRWLLLKRKLSAKQNLFLEIMTFAYIATNSKNSGIDIKKTTRESFDYKGRLKKDIVYEMVVDVEEG